MPRLLPRWLLVATLLELFLGGNGHLTEIAGVRLRLLLFLLCLAWAAGNLMGRSRMRLPRHVWALLVVFLLTTFVGVSNGLANGNGMSEVASEFTGPLYILMLLVFAMAIRTREDVHLVVRLVILCASIQAALFLSLLALTHAGVLGHAPVFYFLRKSQEFIFRPGPDDTYFLGFFYTGMFYLGVAALFQLFVPQYRNYGLAALAFVAIVLTETRSLLVGACFATFVGMLIRRRWLDYLGLNIAVLGLALLLMFTDTFEFLSRPVSDAVRLHDFHWLMEHFEVAHIFVGYGMGSPIGDRPRIELTYLEILYKQGLLGLFPWVAIYVVNLMSWLNAKRHDAPLALALHLGALYVFVAAIANNFLTGPLGMGVVLLSTVCLDALRKDGFRTGQNGFVYA